MNLISEVRAPRKSGRRRRAVAARAVGFLLLAGLPGGGAMAAEAFELGEITRLAQGAVLGEKVSEPVPGFEIRFLHEGRPIYPR
jgi:hypothetical protein